MITKKEPNRFTGEALRHIEEINNLISDYKSTEQHFTESQKQLEKAKADVDVILNETDAEPLDCAERLVMGDAMVKVFEHRLALNQNSVVDRLVSLASAVDGGEGFAMGASGYMARAIRQRKIAEIAQELSVNPGKVDTQNIVIKRHPKALAAEALASTSRLGQFGNFDTIGATQALQHAERVLLKLQKLAEFEFR